MIDLHAHTTVSDGTDSPAELVAKAAAAGLEIVAITDHDSTAGWDEAAAEAARRGVGLVRGAEISTRHAGMSVHLLAYLFDPDEPVLAGALAEIRDSRLPRLRKIVDLMSADGVDISWADVESIATQGTTAGRPHIADALVAKGVVRHRDEAFADWLHNGSRYYVPHYTLGTAEAIDLVLAAGGVPVVAHPFADKRGRTLSEDHVRELAEVGLVGIEVDHRDNEERGRARAAALATELGLVPTGSSDYHGLGKVNALGEHTTSPESLAAIEAAVTSPTDVLR